MNRRIGVEHWYKCQTGDQYHKEHKYENSLIEELVDRISKRLVNFYGETDSFLYRYYWQLFCCLHHWSLYSSTKIYQSARRVPNKRQRCCNYGISATDL